MMSNIEINEKALSVEIAKGLSKAYFRAEIDLNECYFQINQQLMEEHINQILKETMRKIKEQATENIQRDNADWCDAEFS